MLTIRKRCIRCRQYLREDGTCQNEKCVRFTPEVDNNADDAAQTDANDTGENDLSHD